MSDVNFIVGSICYLPDNDKVSKRIAAHQKQLDWIMNLRKEQSLQFPYYRVQSAWGDEARSKLAPLVGDDVAIEVGQQYPGTNRNELLRVLYESDYDWLVCMDDDRALYPYYNADAFFSDLGTVAMKQLAKAGSLLHCVAPNATPFKSSCAEFAGKEDFWYVRKGSPNGFLQICFIPNLVKYGYKPIWFSDSKCTDGEPPEDVQFQLDWLINKHPLLINNNLVMKEFTNDSSSSVFHNAEHRAECFNYHKDWVSSYLKQKLPRNPKLWSKTELNKHRNVGCTIRVPRTEHYEFQVIDLPKEKK